MNTKLLSIIIPFYNPNTTLFFDLLNSLNNIKKNSIEIILVNDGSDIDIKSLVNKFKDNENFLYFEYKNNLGVSNARNFGLKQSKGKYVTFCDCDDLINVDFINYFLKNNAIFTDDLYLLPIEYDLNCNNDFIFNDKQIFFEKINTLSLKDLPNLSYISSCSKLIKRNIILDNNIFYNTLLTRSEDTLFMMMIFDINPSICLLDGFIFYIYRTNFYSVSRKWDSSFNNQYFCFFNEILKSINDTNLKLLVYRDTICIYCVTRVCMSFKHFRFHMGFSFLKNKFVFQASNSLLDNKFLHNKKEIKIAKFISKRLYFIAYNYIVFKQVLFKVFCKK